jgi:glutathione S-transferase
MLKLYYAPGTCAMATHLALEYAGADYEAVRLDFSKSEQRSPDYLKLNPKGRVPAIVTERGVLTETPALLQYVAQAYPKAQLAPLDDPWLLAKANEFNSYLCSTVHVNHAHKGRGYRWADDTAAHEAMKAKVAQNMGDCFELIEREMLRGPFVLGERLSTCDFYLFTIVQWLPGDGVDAARYPRVEQIAKAVKELPSTQRVLAA